MTPILIPQSELSDNPYIGFLITTAVQGYYGWFAAMKQNF